MKFQLWNHPFHFWTMVLVTALLFFGCMSSSQSGDPVMNTPGKDKYLIDGQLLPCPDKPNCVSSESPEGDSHIAPLEFTENAPIAWETIQDLLVDMGGQIEEVDDSFLHATFRSRIFRFVDDVTCLLDEENSRIHIRSAARVGHSDFGVNRKRVDELRKRFASSFLQK
jgi:uncharacterized protein (DUF1499 family)